MSRLLIILLFFPLQAYANTSLNFEKPETRRENQAVLISKTNGLVANTDLNNDLIDEYIVKSCETPQLCAFSVIAFKAYKPIIIGKFNAHKIVISSEKTYGIRNLIVYNQPHNDFAFQTAIWDPYNFSFEMQ